MGVKSLYIKKYWDHDQLLCLCINCRQSVKEELYILHTSELGPKSFYFCVEGFCRCICTPVYKIVQDRPIIERYRICNSIEGPKARVLYVFVPMCQFCICRLYRSCRIEYVPEPLYQIEGDLYIGILGEQYLTSFGLVLRPVVGRFIKQVPTPGQELFPCVPIAKFFWDECPVLCPCLLYLLVLPVYGVPPVFDADVLKGFKGQFLYVEPVRYLYRLWEACFGDGLHGVGHIQGDFFDLGPFLGRYL